MTIVDEFVMFIPNSFTPDGDGYNDFWSVTGIDVDPSHFKLWIYDRWGEVVFYSEDMDKIWNGSHMNGQYYVPDGVYVYRIETRSLTTQDNKMVKGHVTILR